MPRFRRPRLRLTTIVHDTIPAATIYHRHQSCAVASTLFVVVDGPIIDIPRRQTFHIERA